ncbi:Ring finger protein [Chamberlinius hualienensis]
MLSRDKDDFCPACGSLFDIKCDRDENTYVLPCVLPCGHLMCNICIGCIINSQTDVRCTVCKEVSSISSNWPVNKYAVGSLYVKIFPPHKIEYKTHELKKNVPTASLSASHGDDHCIFCGLQNVMHRCNRCGLLCNRCLDLNHGLTASMDKVEHEVVPLDSFDNGSGCCSTHSRLKEFFCKDDNQFICACCGFSSEHKGHEIVELVKWKEDNAELVRASVAKASSGTKIVDISYRNVDTIIKNFKASVNRGVVEINKEFDYLHRLLQLRQDNITQEFVNATHVDLENLFKVKSDLKKMRSTFEKLAIEGSRMAKNPHLVSHVTFHQLMDIDNLKCFVEPSDDINAKTFETSQLQNKDDIMTIFNQLGNVIIYKGIGELNIKSLSELPEDVKNKLKSENELFKIHETDIKSMSLRPFVAKSKSLSGQPVALQTIRPVKLSKRLLENSPLTEVTVIHVVSPNEFYIRRKQTKDGFRSLVTDLNAYGSTISQTESSINNVESGDVFLYKSSKYNWVRSRAVDLCNIEGDLESANSDLRLAKCFLFDYGVVEEVPLNELRRLSDEFLDAPEYAVKCSLYKIEPVDKALGWSTDAINQFRNYVLNKEVAMKIYENTAGWLYVDVGRDDCYVDNGRQLYVPASVRDALVFLNHGHFPWRIHIEFKGLGVKRKYPVTTNPVCNKDIRAHICHCVTPSEFYVQTYNNDSLFEEIMAKIQQLPFNEMEPLSGPQIGMPCLAKYVDDIWYRAEILSLEKGCTVCVVYVDFGNVRTLSYKDLRYIDQQFLMLPKQAWCCCLADVLPFNGKWSSEAIQYFIDQVDQQDVFLNIKYSSKKVFSVVLQYLDEENLANINEQLVAKNFCSCSGPASASISLRPSRTNEEAIDYLYKSGLRSEQSTVLHGVTASAVNGVKVKVTYAETPSLIYLRNAESHELFTNLQSNLNEFGLNLEKSDETLIKTVQWNELDVCAFYDAEHSAWCRGRILSFNGETAEVFAIDIGMKLVLNINIIHQLPGNLQTPAIELMRCHLDGILPAGGCSWSLLANEELAELITYENIEMIKLGNEVNGSIPIDLIAHRTHIAGALEPTRTIHISFTEDLLEKGYALPAYRNRNIRLPGAPNVDNCAVKAVNKGVCNSNAINNWATSFGNTKWKLNNVKPEKGARIRAIVNGIIENGEISFNFETDNADSSIVSIQRLLNNPDNHVMCNSLYLDFKDGDCCLAKFEDDDINWHRVRVLKNADSNFNSIMISYVDYGNFREVLPENVRGYSGEPIDLPEQAAYCTLYGVSPITGKWNVEGLKVLATALKGLSVVLEVVVPETEESRMQVNVLWNDGSSSIQKILVKLGHATYDAPKKILKMKGVRQLNTGNSGVMHMEKEKKVVFSEGTFVKLHLEQFVPPNKFYGTYTCDSYVNNCFNEEILSQLRRLDEITTIMNEKANNWPPVLNLENNILCCAFSEAKQRWVRLRVISNRNETTSEAFLIDYGNTEILDSSGFRNMLDGVDSFPPQATLYQLYQMVPAADDWDAHVVEQLEEICKKEYVACIRNVDSSIVYIDLLEEIRENGHSLAYQSLLDAGFIKLNAIS